MGFELLIFNCVACGRRDTGNANALPSLRVSRGPDGKMRLDPDGLREPLCRHCANLVNENRVRDGLAPIPIADGAYEAREVA